MPHMRSGTKASPSRATSAFYQDVASLSARIANTHFLNEGKERALLTTYRTTTDDGEKAKALDLLVSAHLPLIRRIAKSMPPNPYTSGMDLIQAGSIGLIEAINRFDADKNIRLASYAARWIKGEMSQLDIETRGGSFPYPASSHDSRRVYFNFPKNCRAQGIDPDKQISPSNLTRLANALSVSPDMVADYSAYYQLHGQPLSLSTPVSSDRDSATILEQISDEKADPAKALEENNSSQNMARKIAESLETLSPAQRRIITARWLNDDEEPVPQHELAREFGITVQAVSAAEQAAFKKLRKAFGIAAETKSTRVVAAPRRSPPKPALNS